MDWVTIAFLLLAVAFVVWRIRSSRSTTTVPDELRVDMPDSELQAIEYYWRPG